MEELLKKINSVQSKFEDITDLKIASLESCLKLLPSTLKQIIDIGYVEKYKPLYDKYNFQVFSYNLPDYDMHEFDIPCEAVVMRHVLEHSPFPLLVLDKIYKSLSDKGYLIVIVPKLIKEWITFAPHFTILTDEGWRKLFKFCGYNLIHFEEGIWRDDDLGKEYRYILQKGVTC